MNMDVVVREILEPQDFHGDDRRAIYKAMLDMEETDYKTEFNLMWRQWIDCKEERNEALGTLELLRGAIKELLEFNEPVMPNCICARCQARQWVERLLD